jgi:TIR domain
MEVFLSWSGSRSKMVAESLRKWLPGVLQSVDPWISGADIEAGARWHQALSLRLNQCNFGVICLTPENLGSRWLLYEAGALSKSVEGSSVVPYLLGLRKADVDGPLAHFQSVEADAEGTYSLLGAMNAVLPGLNERQLPENTLREAFNLWWPKLDEAIRSALAAPVLSATSTQTRSSDQMIQEVVENTRSIAGTVVALAQRLEASSPPKLPSGRLPAVVEPEIIEKTRTVLGELIHETKDDAAGNSSMEAAISRWQSVVENPQSTFEALNEAIRLAKNLRDFQNR